MSAHNILILEANSHYQFAHDLLRLNKAGNVIVHTASAYSSVLALKTKNIVLPFSEWQANPASFFSVIQKHNVTAVIGCTDETNIFISQHSQKLDSLSVKVLSSSFATNMLFRDKLQTSQQLQQAGIPHVPAVDFEQLPSTPSFPLYLKPRYGTASFQHLVIQTPEELKMVNNQYAYIASPVIKGYELNVQGYIDFHTKELVGFTSQFFLEKTQTRAIATETFFDEALENTVKIFCEKFDLVGAFDLDIFQHEGAYKILEVNSRISANDTFAKQDKLDFAKLYMTNVKGKTNSSQMISRAKRVHSSYTSASSFSAPPR